MLKSDVDWNDLGSWATMATCLVPVWLMMWENRIYGQFDILSLNKCSPVNAEINKSRSRFLLPHTSPRVGGERAVAASASKSSNRRFVITEKAPTRAFSWLKAASTAFTFKTLLRHYAKRALTPRSLNVKLGPRRKLSWGTGGYKTLC